MYAVVEAILVKSFIQMYLCIARLLSSVFSFKSDLTNSMLPVLLYRPDIQIRFNSIDQQFEGMSGDQVTFFVNLV